MKRPRENRYMDMDERRKKEEGGVLQITKMANKEVEKN